jgi:hypothetical protein
MLFMQGRGMSQNRVDHAKVEIFRRNLMGDLDEGFHALASAQSLDDQIRGALSLAGIVPSSSGESAADLSQA